MASEESSKNLLVIDTDCGVDDAMAIMLALTYKDNTRVLAVTCCAGNTTLDNVCNNVMRVLVVCKEKKIPVYRGSAGPLVFPFVHKDNDNKIHGDDGLGNTSKDFSTEDMEIQKKLAAIALIELARKYPKELYVAALGPLTNIAMAHRLDPSFTSNLKGLVLLGGNYQGHGNYSDAAEFNFFFDPEAAHVVTTESKCPITMVPWETVVASGIDWVLFEEFEKEIFQFKTERARFLRRLLAFGNKKFQKNKDIRFYDCDLLAIAALLTPESIASVEQFPVTVECSGSYARGQVIVKRRSQEGNKIKIVTGFKKDIIHQLRVKNAQD